MDDDFEYKDMGYEKYSNIPQTIEVKECLPILEIPEWGLFVDGINNVSWWYNRKTKEQIPYSGEESNPNNINILNSNK